MNPPSLLTVYQCLHEHFGPQQWWPAETPYEVLVGAVLTQNTAWNNVELAIANLRSADALAPDALLALPIAELERLIRPAGFFRQKAARLHGITRILLAEHRGELSALCGGELDDARRRLLKMKGIGPETADSILLYAAERPSFVVDAYTGRLFSRLAVLSGHENYAEIRSLFMRQLPVDTALYNEFHALIVVHCKRYCRKQKPACVRCPLQPLCPASLSI